MTHWKKLTNPNYLGVYALEDGKSLVLTVKSVGEETVQNKDGKEDCVVMHFCENVKPMILNKTNLKTMEKLMKTPYVERWTGKKIEVESQRVKAFGDIVDALRIKDRLPSGAAPVKCAVCGADIAPMGNMSGGDVAKYTAAKYGKPLCASCATKAAAAKTAEDKAKEETENTAENTTEGEKHENDEN